MNGSEFDLAANKFDVSLLGASDIRFELTDSDELMMIVGEYNIYFSKAQMDVSSWLCPNCGNNASGQFCNNCGSAFPGAAVTRSGGDSGKTYSFNAGTYKIGEDIPAGTYEITCTSVEDTYGEYMDSMSQLYSSLGDDYASLGTYFDALGSLAGDPTATVRVKDAAGYTVKSTELKKDDKVTFELKEGASLVIEDGSCSLVSK